jgi:hypothetical protein
MPQEALLLLVPVNATFVSVNAFGRVAANVTPPAITDTAWFEMVATNWLDPDDKQRVCTLRKKKLTSAGPVGPVGFTGTAGIVGHTTSTCSGLLQGPPPCPGGPFFEQKQGWNNTYFFLFFLP